MFRFYDDVIVNSETFDEHVAFLDRVLAELLDANLTIGAAHGKIGLWAANIYALCLTVQVVRVRGGGDVRVAQRRVRALVARLQRAHVVATHARGPHGPA